MLPYRRTLPPLPESTTGPSAQRYYHELAERLNIDRDVLVEGLVLSDSPRKNPDESNMSPRRNVRKLESTVTD